jgi:hypothetical protein
MSNPQSIENKDKQLLEFLAVQVEQKVRQVENATKLYFQSLIVLGAGVAIAVTALNWKSAVLIIFTFGIPSFLIAWFGCFLFIYWEHHMLRISLDYSEKKASEALGIPPSETYLYHEDFLGVFNQAKFIFKWIKSVQAVFVIIGAPAGIVFIYSVFKAKEYFRNNLDNYVYYVITILTAAIILFVIHYQCIRRERKLKRELGIVPVQERQEVKKKKVSHEKSLL